MVGTWNSPDEVSDMTEKPPKENDKLPEAEVESRFNRAIQNALATPHKPHAKKGSGEPNPPKVSVPKKG